MRFFCSLFCTYRSHIGQIIRLLNFFYFVLEFADLFKFFTFGGDSVDGESDSASTQWERDESSQNRHT
jgi:hypothetical protein